jgi:hypothetical protein
MSHIYVRSERSIDASPEEVYAALTDYKNKRPRMLTPNFLDYTVEQGGHGSGTVISYRLRAAGRERPYRMQVNEAIPGRVITEHDQNSSLVTRWSVLPLNGGQKSRVTIESEWEGGSGIGGFFERTFAPLGLRKIYDNVLAMLLLLVQTSEKNCNMLLAEDEARKVRMSTVAVGVAAAGLILALGIGLRHKWVKA